PELKETVTNLGLEYRLMTQFTSFVAVEEMIVTDGGQPRRIDVPVEGPEGVNRDMVTTRDGISLAINGRSVQGFALLSRGGASATQSVVVTGSAPSIDTSRTDSTTVIDRKVIEFGG